VPPHRPRGTEGYAEQAATLVTQYESISFASVHESVFHLIPSSPCRVLDIGAGTGRDAAGFAAQGHRVLAVEPTEALRTWAVASHASPRIEWLDDDLPALAGVRRRGENFDVVMLTAVWMHLDREQRRIGMPNVASLMREGGVMILSLRHGLVPSGRRMFDVGAEETIALAEAEGLRPVYRRDHADGSLSRAGVSWTRLGFSKPARDSRQFL
jgi:SAM-dependent methyltransferase